MYIDPGTGSLVIQVIGAALVAVTASFKSVRHFFGSLVARYWRRGS